MLFLDNYILNHYKAQIINVLFFSLTVKMLKNTKKKQFIIKSINNLNHKQTAYCIKVKFEFLKHINYYEL